MRATVFVYAGMLPETWASQGAFQNVQLLDLSDTLITGSIPPAWAGAEAFPNLVFLDLNHTKLTGSLPAFYNRQLQILIGNDCAFNGNLTAIWSSSSPFTAILLAGNAIVDNLPTNSSAFPNLAFLDLSANELKGQVPISWLQHGKILSHITGLSVGPLWEASQNSKWKAELCLQSGLYEAHMAAHDLDPIQAPLQMISDIPSFDSDIAVYYAPLSALFATLQSQLESVGDLCEKSC